MSVNASGCQRNDARHPKAKCRKRHEQDASGRAGHHAGDREPSVARTPACPEGARGADEGPGHRGEQREGDQVDVQVVAMQGGAGVDRVADERVDGVALDE
jgi:hypothetical protein